MKILIIPDLHGKTCWKDAIVKNNPDKVVFLGDYVDSSIEHVSDDQIFENLKDIIQYKIDNQQTELLLGNHDISYFYYPDNPCSGFRISMLNDLNLFFNKNASLFRIAYQYKNNLFTHAGVTNNWLKSIGHSAEQLGIEIRDNLADYLNTIYDSRYRDVLFRVGRKRGGYYSHGGPLWCDRSEFSNKEILKGYHQYVGHTKQKSIKTRNYDNRRGENFEGSITFCDVLDYCNEFIVVGD